VLVLSKGYYINKVVSTVLLVVLLFIHSIKLLHSHSNDNISENSHSEIFKSSPDCNICSYQLNKDADDLTAHVFSDFLFEQSAFNPQLISFHRLSFYSAFETRGPPFGI
jgi:hypothetical protein